MQGTGTGGTQEEAIHNALAGAASTVTTRIRGETVDRQRETRGSGGTTGKETVTSKLDATSMVAFSGYKANVTQGPDGNFTATVRATPGLVHKK